MKTSQSVNPILYKERKDSHHRAIIGFDPTTLLTCNSCNIVLRINVRKKTTALLECNDLIDIPVIRVNKTLMDGNGTCTVTQRSESYGDTSSITVYIGRQDVEGVNSIEMELIMSYSFDIDSVTMALGGGRGWTPLKENKGYFVQKRYDTFSVVAMKDINTIRVTDYCTISLLVSGERDLNDIFVDTDKLCGVELSFTDYVDDSNDEKRLYVLFLYYRTSTLDTNYDGQYIIPHVDIYHKGIMDSIHEIIPPKK